VFSLRLLHGGSSKGAFISVSSGGVVVFNRSEITSEASGYVGLNDYDLCIYS
jgi:hypothetical protein